MEATTAQQQDTATTAQQDEEQAAAAQQQDEATGTTADGTTADGATADGTTTAQAGETTGEFDLVLDLESDDGTDNTDGTDATGEGAPAWVKELRKQQRELRARNKELEEQLAARTSKEQEPPALGKKPELADFNFDSDEYEAALAKWIDEKRAHEVAAEKQKAREAEQVAAWTQKLEDYTKARTELTAKVPDYEEAELEVKSMLSTTQQGLIVNCAKAPALVVLALGKNSVHLTNLAKVSDPAKFAYELGKLEHILESKMKKPPTKPAAAPEKIPAGSGSFSASTNATLDKLRREAESTGDYTKVVAYKAKQRNKGTK